MVLIPTGDLKPGVVPYQQQVYNALDCCVTVEVLEKLQHIHQEEPVVYRFEKALQAPAIEMMCRGILVDEAARKTAIQSLEEDLAKLDAMLQQLAFAVWGRTVNPRSTIQLQNFFYGAMHLPEIWISDKGKRRLSMNREVLEKLSIYFHARPICNIILKIRDLSKKLETLKTEVDHDGRIRTSYNIAGTETGRWSSSASAFGTGGNLQNWEQKLRRVLVADPGNILVGIDLEQAESREVGWLSGTIFDEWSYYDACLAGDLHTLTAKLIWPNRPWTGDPKRDKDLAEEKFYREFSYRDMSKRGGHGSNYYGTPLTMARHLKVPPKLMADFQQAYFSAYPGIPKYHRWVAQQIQTKHFLETIFGRKRHFFGRANDDTTLREAIAFLPQSSTADRMNLILWRLWKHHGHEIQILAQIHDAVYFQVREDHPDIPGLIATCLGRFDIDFTHKSGRKLIVPGEAKVGWNFANQSPANPDGLAKWKGALDRVRTTRLDRVM